MKKSKADLDFELTLQITDKLTQLDSSVIKLTKNEEDFIALRWVEFMKFYDNLIEKANSINSLNDLLYYTMAKFRLKEQVIKLQIINAKNN